MLHITSHHPKLKIDYNITTALQFQYIIHHISSIFNFFIILIFQREYDSYDTQQQHNEAVHRISTLNTDQRLIFDAVEAATHQQNPSPIFIGASPGTGKSYLLNTILSHFRSQNLIALACASTSSASLLLTGGKTLHSQFKVPINIHDDSMCNIRRGSRLATLISAASLIIIDEVPHDIYLYGTKFCNLCYSLYFFIYILYLYPRNLFHNHFQFWLFKLII